MFRDLNYNIFRQNQTLNENDSIVFDMPIITEMSIERISVFTQFHRFFITVRA